MIYITQLIFVKQGKEDIFIQFEEFAIPLMEAYGGKMIYRLRPGNEAYISRAKNPPYEIQFISFDSEIDLHNFMQDEQRLEFMQLNPQVATS